jgi:CHAT domain-containing protein
MRSPAGVSPADRESLYVRILDDAVSGGERGIEARALHEWADELFAAGQYAGALARLDRAALLYDALGSREALGTVFNSIGRVYRAHGRLDEALRFQLRALDLHNESGTPFTRMQSLNAVATVHQRMGHLAEARQFFDQALAIAETSSSPRIQDLLRANIAGLLIEEGQYERGAHVIEQVIAHQIDSYPSQRFAALAHAYLHMGRPKESLAWAEQALAACGGFAGDCVTALRRRAGARAALGEPAAALADVDAALHEVETMRTKLVPTDFFKQEFHRVQDDVFSEAIAVKSRLHQKDGALETAELARARAFLDLLASRDVPLKDPDRSQVVTAPPATVRDIAALAARLRSTFVLYWAAEDALFIWVVAPDGRTEARRVDVRRSRLTQLIRSTSPFDQPSNTASAVSGSAVVLTRGARQKLPGPPGPASWRELYDVLIRPIRTVLPTTPGALITIVPQGPLLNLSFAALQDVRGRYLLEDYTLHYVPAAAVLQFTEPKRRPDARKGGVLLVADPVPPVLSPLDSALPRLRGSRDEVQAIARLVDRRRLLMLADESATEAGVRAGAAGRTVVHLATHAIVRDDDPFGSFLALSAGGGPGADGILLAQEIYGWELQADLVVLSACRSGGGRFNGDGIAAFTRAFIYAGTPSLVSSLWDVADEPTNRLLPGFYRAWFAGASKARALRAAQLQLLRDLRAGRITIGTPAGRVALPEHPVFWAGFVLIGEPN